MQLQGWCQQANIIKVGGNAKKSLRVKAGLLDFSRARIRQLQLGKKMGEFTRKGKHDKILQ